MSDELFFCEDDEGAKKVSIRMLPIADFCISTNKRELKNNKLKEVICLSVAHIQAA